MTPALFLVGVMASVFGGICWHERRAMRRNEITICDVPASIAPSLAAVLTEYASNGGDFNDVIGYGVNAHPSGAHHVYLVTQADVVAGAERILDGAA